MNLLKTIKSIFRKRGQRTLLSQADNTPQQPKSQTPPSPLSGSAYRLVRYGDRNRYADDHLPQFVYEEYGGRTC